MPVPDITLDRIRADLATVEALLGAVPEGDILGRRSLTARRDILTQELATLMAHAQPAAHGCGLLRRRTGRR
jgi:hypothetical protein